MKNVVKSSKHFFGHFNTLETHSVMTLSKGNWFIIPDMALGKNIDICNTCIYELTKWWGVRPKPCLCASDDRLSDEYVSLMAAVLHCISHQVMSVVHHFAIEWRQG